ncbi:putative lumazine-binding protein [compost metagenome]
MVFADESRLRQAFHPACRIVGHFHGSLEWMTLDEFIGEIKAEDPPASDTRPFWEIRELDVTGDCATAKVVDDFLGLRFTDYLSLLKIDRQWRVINKLFYLHV